VGVFVRDRQPWGGRRHLPLASIAASLVLTPQQRLPADPTPPMGASDAAAVKKFEDGKHILTP